MTAEYGATGNSYSVRNGSEWSISTANGNPVDISAQGFDGQELHKRTNGGTLYVDVYSDIEAPTTRQAPGSGGQPVSVTTGDRVEYTGSSVVLGRGRSTSGELNGQPGTFTCAQTGCSVSFQGGLPNQGSPLPVSSVSGITFVPSGGTGTVSTPDTDYLAGGVWLFVPDNATSADDFVFGAFGNGNDPFRQSNLVALQGNARYAGEATGVYSEKSDGATEIGYLDADVALTANFGGQSELGTINGSLHSF